MEYAQKCAKHKAGAQTTNNEICTQTRHLLAKAALPETVENVFPNNCQVYVAIGLKFKRYKHFIHIYVYDKAETKEFNSSPYK